MHNYIIITYISLCTKPYCIYYILYLDLFFCVQLDKYKTMPLEWIMVKDPYNTATPKQHRHSPKYEHDTIVSGNEAGAVVINLQLSITSTHLLYGTKGLFIK